MDNGKNKPRPEAIRRDNQAFLNKLLASVVAAVEAREKAGVYGELTIKISQESGRIKGAKILEEAILKPEDG